jgi:hypothetical protein
LILRTSLGPEEPCSHTAVPGCLERILTTLLNHDEGHPTELGMREIVFGMSLPPGARSNMCFVVRVVAVHLTAAAAVVAVGKHYPIQPHPNEFLPGVCARTLWLFV